MRALGSIDSVANPCCLRNRYLPFPYNQSVGGFYDENMCLLNGTVNGGDTPNEGGYYSGDWAALNTTTAWIKDRAAEQQHQQEQRRRGMGGDPKPFFAYQGMNIVHPAYFTNKYWFDQVNQSAVTVPKWKGLSELHPCDYQASMLKGCIPTSPSNAEFVYSAARRRRVRSIYYAMILEFDNMVGAYMDAIEEAGATDNTVLIVTSDHGDMNMEHQQFYKMVQYDASARVPLIIRMPVNHKPYNIAPPMAHNLDLRCVFAPSTDRCRGVPTNTPLESSTNQFNLFFLIGVSGHRAPPRVRATGS